MARNRTGIFSALLLALPGIAPGAAAQCLLANPSFELPGGGSGTFAGWNQFGSVGVAPAATHGAEAVRVSGPDLGGWDVSGVWQRLDSAPGERWSTSVRVWHSDVRPLTGQSRAILNIEWRDAAGLLIDFESHDAADASTPVDEVQRFSVESAPAPPGTAATHFLLGVLQGPADPAPDVFYDEATFDNFGPPTLDELQWNDFPGGRTLDFSGRPWRVKGPGFYGPGPNWFSDATDCVWVDARDRLHLTVQDVAGIWRSTEVTLEQPLGYGDYVFTTSGRLDTLDPSVVLGMFLWQYAPCYEPGNAWWNPYNEIDVEFSRWGDPGRDVAQFVVQPFDFPGNLDRFDVTFTDGELTSHAFEWLPDRIEYRSWRGGPADEFTGEMIHTWTYSGPQIPRPEQPRVHVNLWQLDGAPPAPQEIVLDVFTFVPADSVPVAAPEIGPAQGPPATLSGVWPNPFRPPVTIRCAVARAGQVEIVVHDVAGRRVRNLANRFFPAGDHEVVWDGRDQEGHRVTTGVYLCRLRVGNTFETRRLVLVR